MGLSSNRRHRLQAHEVEPVMAAVRRELETLVEYRKGLYLAETLFKVLYRWTEHYEKGRPIYPEPITWGLISDWLNLNNGPFIGAEEGSP